MGKSITEQLLEQGAVKPADTPAAKRARENAERPPLPERELPPPFDAPASGRIVERKREPR
jgi:hypothetical protein